ncbi:hypothetical protein K438DRAFT_2024115 [Mycena galopus ATCC 62051]|nr:hypothetical protein K438DRAFT_2024115 [Mycena galopus ATCC 62051]
MPLLAKVLFRPQYPALHYSFTSRRLLATVKETSAPGTSDGAPSEIVEKFPRASFYRTKLHLRNYSCQWEEFSDWRFFCISPEWHDLTEMEFFIKRLCKVRGTIRPLAFLPFPEPCIAFEAGGMYYYLDTCRDFLERFGHNFASDDAFLSAFTRRRRILGKLYRFPDDTDRLYWAVVDEQPSPVAPLFVGAPHSCPTQPTFTAAYLRRPHHLLPFLTALARIRVDPKPPRRHDCSHVPAAQHPHPLAGLHPTPAAARASPEDARAERARIADARVAHTRASLRLPRHSHPRAASNPTLQRDWRSLSPILFSATSPHAVPFLSLSHLLELVSAFSSSLPESPFSDFALGQFHSLSAHASSFAHEHDPSSSFHSVLFHSNISRSEVSEGEGDDDLDRKSNAGREVSGNEISGSSFGR